MKCSIEWRVTSRGLTYLKGELDIYIDGVIWKQFNTRDQSSFLRFCKNTKQYRLCVYKAEWMRVDRCDSMVLLDSVTVPSGGCHIAPRTIPKFTAQLNTTRWPIESKRRALRHRQHKCKSNWYTQKDVSWNFQLWTRQLILPCKLRANGSVSSYALIVQCSNCPIKVWWISLADQLKVWNPNDYLPFK